MIAVALPLNPFDVTTTAQAQLVLDEIARVTASPGRSVRRLPGGSWRITPGTGPHAWRFFVDALDETFPNYIFGWPNDE